MAEKQRRVLADQRQRVNSGKRGKSQHSQVPVKPASVPQLVPDELIIAGKHILGTRESEYVTPQLFEEMLRKPRSGPDFQPIMITEPLAAYILGNYANRKNRPTKRPSKKKFRDDMENGDWVITPQPITFSFGDDGQPLLIDGHNRLEACAGRKDDDERAGVAFPALVWFGWPKDAITAIDLGVSRSVEDVLRMEGKNIGRDGIQAVRIIHAIEDANKAGPDGQEPTRDERRKRLVRAGAWLSAAEISNWLEKNPGLLPIAMEAMQAGVGVAARAGLIAGLYLVERYYDHDQKMGEAFKAKLVTGLGFEDTNDPIYRLRDRMTAKPPAAKGMQLAAEIVKAWNGFALNRPVKHLAWRNDEPFPDVEA